MSAVLALILGGTPVAAADLCAIAQSWGGPVGGGPVGGTGRATGTTGVVDTARTTGVDRRRERHVVAVVRTPDPDGISQEIVTRIIAELVAIGVPVMVLTCSTVDSDCLPVAGVRLSAVVLVARHDNDRRAVEVWSGDSFESGGAGTLVAISDQRGRAQRLANGDARWEPAALAIRTVELLKAMRPEEADVAPAGDAHGPQAPQAPRAPNDPVEQQPDPEPVPGPTIATGDDGRATVPAGPHNVTMNVGIAVIGGFSGLQTAYGPSVSIGRRTSKHVLLSFVLDGPAFGPDQPGMFGTASIRQEMATVQADLLGLFWKSLVLRAGIGAGVYHIHVDGTGPGFFASTRAAFVPPSGGASGFSWLLSWSAGVVANLRQDVAVFLDLRMFVLTPTQAVALGGQELGRAGNPGVTLSSGVELRF
jgi:hypothetical protein